MCTVQGREEITMEIERGVRVERATGTLIPVIE